MKKRNLPILISIILISLLALATVINFSYINNVGNKLNALTVSATSSDAAMDLQRYWRSQTNIVSITVSNSAIERLTDAIDTLVCYAKSERDEELPRSIALVLNAIDGMRRLERFSINNIL
jgi:type II secretory pathway pseudopilin PulG